MKICYLDAFSGISGDMAVGALVDAGANREALRNGLNSLHTGASFSFNSTSRRGIAATKFQVHGGEPKTHRNLPQILEMIDGADVPDAVKRNTAAVYQCLAEGLPIDNVRFHEIGAVDSICDIVGACHALALLEIDELHTSAINMGAGTPGTAKLLAGKPLYSRGPQVELTTPTGAAIVSALSKFSGSFPAMSLQASGYGAGDRDFQEHANVLRVLIGDSGNPR